MIEVDHDQAKGERVILGCRDFGVQHNVEVLTVPRAGQRVGQDLFALLADPKLDDPLTVLDEDMLQGYVHLIGHGRGALLNSEAAQRLLMNDFAVDQMTVLDGAPFELSGAGEMPADAWLYALRIEVGHAWLEGAFVETQTRWEVEPRP